MSVGIRSGVNWMRLLLSESAWARLVTSEVLASPGTPTSKPWPLGEERDQQQLDHLLLADDAPPQLLDDLLPRFGKARDQLDIVVHAKLHRFVHGVPSVPSMRRGCQPKRQQCPVG